MELPLSSALLNQSSLVPLSVIDLYLCITASILPGVYVCTLPLSLHYCINPPWCISMYFTSISALLHQSSLVYLYVHYLYLCITTSILPGVSLCALPLSLHYCINPPWCICMWFTSISASLHQSSRVYLYVLYLYLCITASILPGASVCTLLLSLHYYINPPWCISMYFTSISAWLHQSSLVPRSVCDWPLSLHYCINPPWCLCLWLTTVLCITASILPGVSVCGLPLIPWSCWLPKPWA